MPACQTLAHIAANVRKEAYWTPEAKHKPGRRLPGVGDAGLAQTTLFRNHDESHRGNVPPLQIAREWAKLGGYAAALW
ncbi:hypothetical protein GCM10007928_48100 [Sulfitobacter porphyrae]|nr:hypothetical protein GCM10007928_48100 [Sulfitobacter porphyrae]